MMLGGGIPRVLFEESTLLWHNGSNKVDAVLFHWVARRLSRLSE